jgi:hypothetical protein
MANCTRLHVVVGILGSFLAAACEEDSAWIAEELCTPVAPADPTISAGTIDDRLAGLAATVEGFGGFELSGSILRVYLVNPDPEQGALAQTALAALFDSPELAAAELAVAAADYDYRDLVRWRAVANNVLGLPYVVSTDVDEASNRLVYGVSDKAGAPCVRENLDALGIPSAAAEIRIEPAIEAL